jgi:hypothetical protein
MLRQYKGEKMSTCQSCGGIIGRDCFNPSECAWIEKQQANQAESYYQSEQEAQHILQKLKAEIAATVEQLQRAYAMRESPDVLDCISKLRQLSAV